MNCSICGSDKKIIHYHLSYEPEIIVMMCHKCHLAMHLSAELSQEERNIITSWINHYGHLWKNGGKKYQKTEHYKKYQKIYKQTDKAKDTRKKYSKTDKFKNYQKNYKRNKKIMDVQKRI